MGRRASVHATVSIAMSGWLEPLAPRPYTSLVLTDTPRPAARPRPVVAVEKRPLAVYGRLTGGLA
jgi:hypothetical protein